MVTTRSRNLAATLSQGERPRSQGERSDRASEPVAPPPQTQSIQPSLLATLAQQIETLTAMVRNLQQPPVSTRGALPEEVPVPMATPHVAKRTSRGRSHHRRTPCRSRSSSSPRSEEGRKASHRGTATRYPSPVPLPRSHPCRGRSPRREEGRGKRPRPPSKSSQEGSSGSAHQRQGGQRFDEYDRKLHDFGQQLADLRGGNQRLAEHESQPPLSRQILKEPIPRRFRMPQFELYDGTTDPLDHIEGYKALMLLQGASDALLCIAFPATLRKSARAWYTRLEPRSINSFSQLEKKFVANFSACRKLPRNADSLFSVRQKEGEPLRDFIARFRMATLEVYRLDESVAMLAMKRGLRPSRFTYSLDKTSPKSYSEMLARAQKYIRADEAAETRRELEGQPDKKKPREGSGRNKPGPSRQRSPKAWDPASKSEKFTPLLAPRSQILMEIEKESYLRRPDPLKPSAFRNRRKYCRFHRDHGHDTEDCRHLKKEIEDLIQRGYLRNYVRKETTQATPQDPPPNPVLAEFDNRPTEREVGMIGWGAGRSPKRPREEETAVNVISFSQDGWPSNNTHNVHCTACTRASIV